MTTKPVKFYNLTLPERLQYLQQHAGLTDEQTAALGGDNLSAEAASRMIENAAGTYALPLGIAQNFVINGREVLVPMVIEEPSVVAGASFMAKLARAGGGFTARADEPLMIGQMQILDLADPAAAREKLLREKAALLDEANRIDPVLQKLGGGARDMEVRLIDDSPVGAFLVLHLIYDVRDAMGANAVNTAVERLTPRVESITGGRVLLRILSNLADRRLAYAECRIPADQLAFEGFSASQVADGIVEAWAFAAADPYRAATHNKGIMNGVDAVVIATGNDWRAVEAGAHAYAVRNGRYTSLSTWSKEADGTLVGQLEMPMAVGIVGGATRVHPAAQAALKLMGVSTAAELAQIIVSVGLAQNMAALRALATEGIQCGHMSLHARQVAAAAVNALMESGTLIAQDEQGAPFGALIDRLADALVREKVVRIDFAEELLRRWQSEGNM